MSSTERSFSDAAVRIRDLAVRRFAADGYAQTSIRAIAADAGVSLGLLHHHFGSKEALREECDRFVVAELTRRDRESAPAGALTLPVVQDHVRHGGAEHLWRYLGRMLVDGTPQARCLFALLVDETEAAIRDGAGGLSFRDGADARAMAVLLTVQGMAPILLQDLAGTALGLPPDDLVALFDRLAAPMLTLYTQGVILSSGDAPAPAPHRPETT